MHADYSAVHNMNGAGAIDLSYRGGGTLRGPLWLEGTSSPGVSVVGEGRIYFDAAFGVFRVSENGGAYKDLTGATVDLQGAYDNGSVVNLSPGTPVEFNKDSPDSSSALEVNVVDGNGAGLSVQLSGAATGPAAIFEGGPVGVGLTAPHSRLHVNGSLALKTRSVSSNAVAGDEIVIAVDATGGDVTITLPSSVTYPGRNYYIKKMDDSFNFVFVQAAGAQTIDGMNIQRLSVQYETMQIVAHDGGWLKI